MKTVHSLFDFINSNLIATLLSSCSWHIGVQNILQKTSYFCQISNVKKITRDRHLDGGQYETLVKLFIRSHYIHN